MLLAAQLNRVYTRRIDLTLYTWRLWLSEGIIRRHMDEHASFIAT
jgi:hypothetical protein